MANGRNTPKRRNNFSSSPDIAAEATEAGRDRIGIILAVAYWVFLILTAVILGRILLIQFTWKPDPTLAKYLRPHNEKVTLVPQRGMILSHDGRLLAVSTPMYQVRMDCTVMKEENKIKKPEVEQIWLSEAEELSKGLARIYKDKTPEQYFALIKEGREKGRKYVPIGGQIDHETLQEVKALPLFRRGPNRGGIIVESLETRQYPYGALARRTIGHVRNNSSAEVARNKIGIEGKFNYALHGQEGIEWMKVTDGRRYIHNYDSAYVQPTDGNDIRTTLDIDMQDIADRALRHQIEDNMKIEGGCVILMDVETGGIRAMVNLLRDSVTNQLHETYNMAVGRIGEPGSVFKTTTLMTLLEDGKVSLSTEIPTNHGYVKGFTTDAHIYDYERENKTDKISVLHGFEISSNYVFRKLAIDAYGSSPKQMIDRLYMYKLGEAYDFDLDGFSTPTLPSPESQYWSDTDLGSVAIGYSVGETPLHIITFYNAIANKGKMMKPYLVESIEKDGKVVEMRGPTVLNGSICSRATADTLAKALNAVTTEGTGKKVKGAKCSIAGKTGTARIVLPAKYTRKSHRPYEDEQGRKQYQATFVGFFPVEQPRYSAICVVYSRLDREIFYGGTIPALTIREIVDNVYAIDKENGEVISELHSLPRWAMDGEGEESAKTAQLTRKQDKKTPTL